MAEKAVQELERIYTIPLRVPRSSPRNHRADRAIRYVKSYLARHMKAQDVWIDASVNEKLWDHGMYEVPPRIRVRARRFDDGVVEVSLPEVETKESIRSEIQARREAAAEKKEKKKEEEAEAKKEAAKGEKAEFAPAEERKKVPFAERKVIDIEGIGPTYEAQLRPHGITLMDHLLAADVDALAEKTGLSKTLLSTWKAMADLDRLNTVNNQYAELLVRAGITTVAQLASTEPAAVVGKVEAYLKTVERPPTKQPVNEAMATEWVTAARRFVREPTGGKAAPGDPTAGGG